MATYKVKVNQNIWDVALHICGTVEGVFDLMISNNWLSLTTDLKPGMELEYHEDFVVNSGVVLSMRDENYIPANGERHTYVKKTSEPLALICGIPSENESSSLVVSGDGEMYIDWGDNTDLEKVTLSSIPVEIPHYFDNKVDERRIKIYGSFHLLSFDSSHIGGDIFPVKPIVVDEFTSRSNSNSLKGLFLFGGTVKLDLQYMYISDLSPVYDMGLQELNLLGVRFDSVDVIDSYLQNIVNNYGNRRNCTVHLNTEPSKAGMDAIQTIINEEAWNESGAWKFIINDKIYTHL